jgi:hypothetical protein
MNPIQSISIKKSVACPKCVPDIKFENMYMYRALDDSSIYTIMSAVGVNSFYYH